MKPVKKRTKQEILNFVVWYYSRYPRAVDYTENGLNMCNYLTKDGKARCAHSIFIKTEHIPAIMDSDNVSASGVIKGMGDSIHRERYQGHSIEFWSRVQQLHDTNHFWDSEGLTKKGRLAVDNIIHMYKDAT